MPAAPSDRPRRRSRRRRVHLSALKGLIVGPILWLGAHAPRVVLNGVVRGFVGVLRRLYRVPGNPLRTSIEALVVLARRRGIEHEPRAVYQRLLDQCLTIGLGFVEVLYEGPEPAVRRMGLASEDRNRLQALLDAHGGLVLTVTHNVGAVYSAMWISRTFPTLVIARNQKEERNARLAREFFESMGVEVRLVREMSMIELARICLRALREGKLVVATMDLLHRKKQRVTATMWGQEVAFAPWAFRLAADTKSPVVPCYVYVEGDRVGAVVGEAMLDSDPDRLAQHYATFLEAEILRDPASWIFMADKRWRALLVRAAGARA